MADTNKQGRPQECTAAFASRRFQLDHLATYEDAMTRNGGGAYLREQAVKLFAGVNDRRALGPAARGPGPLFSLIGRSSRTTIKEGRTSSGPDSRLPSNSGRALGQWPQLTLIRWGAWRVSVTSNMSTHFSND